MKTFRYAILALLVQFVLAGCTDDLVYTPGEGDQPGTYGVYFPTQTNETALDLDPADPTSKTYTIKRTNSRDEIVVPVVVEATPANVFEVSEIKFAEGQTETEFTVKFDQAEIGVAYTANISVKDKAYAAVTGVFPTALGISVTRTQWNQVLGPNGEQTGKWRDEFLTTIMGSNVRPEGHPHAEKDVVIWERDDKPGYYRIKNIYDEDYLGTICGVKYSDFVFTTPTYTIIDATDKNKVWLPAQKVGCWIPGFFSDSNGEWMFVSFCEENYPGVASANRYGTLKDGILTFSDKAIFFTTADIWEAGSYYLGNSNITRLIMPGYTVKDYSIALTKGEPIDGVVEIGVTFGPDAKKMKYTYFEGTLNDGTASLYANDMNDGKIDFDGEIAASGTIRVEMEQTGVYTIVGCSYDEAGNMKDYTFLPFGYIKAGETKPVVMSVRTELTWENEAEGHTPENSLKGILFGKEIESGYCALAKTASIAGATEAQLTASVKADGKAFTAEEIGKINDKGLSKFFSGLTKGTSYTLLVWVYNGYYGKLFAVEQTTVGDPDPFEIHYTMDDVESMPTKDELYNKTWNYYAADAFDKKDPNSRQYLGQVTFSENTELDAANQDYINVQGLSTMAAQLSTQDDTITALRSASGLFTLTPTNYLGAYGPYHVFNGFTNEEDDYVYDTQNGCIYGGYVADGMIAMVPNPNFVDQGYTFVGLYIGAYSSAVFDGKTFQGGLGHFRHLLFVDAEKDPHTETAAAVSRELALRPARTDYVSLRGAELMQAVWNEVTGRFILSSEMDGEATVRRAAPAKSEFTEGRPVSQAPVAGLAKPRVKLSSILQ